MSTATPKLTPGARRILEVASGLFYRHGIHAVGVDTIAAESGVTKRTLYDRFGSKDELIAAYLRTRHDAWWASLEERLAAAESPRVLALIDAYSDHPLDHDRGCAFVNAAAELEVAHPAHEVIRRHKRAVRSRIAELVREDIPGIDDPDALAEHLFLLVEGAIADCGITGDDTLLAAARRIARTLLSDAAGSVPS